ncbi:hypothetical protein T01_1749 [Trichinella spiralis]|uniref:Uncharacterized protein n=1 Tax=Trichinella spiralis TaxID=6334 RepID=A0A0V1C0F8_TRISP|nr:hypothetical protein T01_1749 [Trichinella spiralis]
MRPVTNSRCRSGHRSLAAFPAAVPSRVWSLPGLRRSARPALAGPCHKPEGSQAPSSGCLSLVGLRFQLLQAEIPLSSIGAPAPHDCPGSRLEPPCRRGNSPPLGFRPARRRGHGWSGGLHSGWFERPRGLGGAGRAPVSGPIPSPPADGVAGDAADDIRPLHTGARCDIPSPGGQSSGTHSKRPFLGACLFDRLLDCPHPVGQEESTSYSSLSFVRRTNV